MCSQKQLEANRLNATKSTGPRTEAGKQKSRLNATTHGLRSSLPQSIVPAEDQEAYATFETAMLDDLNPQGALESLLAQRLSLLAWKLHRCTAAEAALLDQPMLKARQEVEEHNERTLEDHQLYLKRRPKTAKSPPNEPDLEPLPDPLSPAQILAQAFSADDSENAFLPLQRYTTATENSFNRTLKQLHELQKHRLSQSLTPEPRTPNPEP